MTQTSVVAAREPVSDILREAARLGLELPPEMLPDSAALLCGAICDSLIPRLKLKETQRRRIALDTTITLCASTPANAWYRRPCTLWSASLPAVSRFTIYSPGAYPTPSKFSPSTAAAASPCRA